MRQRLPVAVAVLCLAALCILGAAPPAESPAAADTFALSEGTPVLGGSPQPDPQKFTFAILGDRTGGGDWPPFDRAVQELNALRPDFVIMVGDAVQGYSDRPAEIERQWDEFRSHAAPLRMPLILVPGNHDVSNPQMAEAWRETLGLTHYRFDYAGCRFIVLDTEEPKEQGGKGIGLSAEQQAWAVEAIRGAKDLRHTFVFMHAPLWAMTEESAAEWRPLAEALAPLPHTVFAGHVHNLTRFTVGGRRWFTLGPTGGVLKENPDRSLGAFHHYTIVTVEKGEATIAIVEPGAIHPEDVATAERKAEAVVQQIEVGGMRVALEAEGLRVEALAAGSVPARAGLRPGDLITDIAGQPVGGMTVESAARIAALLAGRATSLTVRSPDGAVRRLRLTMTTSAP